MIIHQLKVKPGSLYMLTLLAMWVLLNPLWEVELKKFKSHPKIRCLNQSLNPHVLSMKAYVADLSIKVTSSTATKWPQRTTSWSTSTPSFYHLSVLSKMCCFPLSFFSKVLLPLNTLLMSKCLWRTVPLCPSWI